ncbi:hypothetical protein CLV84_3011 [Neolewinella xylanilytica]|uniref:Outer membrane protein with beta-barrel domain n=1 Tax=Neolewinella xylanilytica TaxID=1514080 RepID=A0A2S6I4L4_9BACT|nr:hypothetical protein [Neolewinella xylanilytica]PPK86094.1 hypothetical protein CLV84_3011 [Neolewinella xylanilytica]
MRLSLLIYGLLLACYCPAQSRSDTGLADIVEVRGEPDLIGTLIGYRYGESVTIVVRNGEVVTIPWDRVGRVTFRQENTSEPIDTENWFTRDTLEVLPGRRWRHQLLVTTGLGNESFGDGFGSFGSVGLIGPGVHYHLLYSRGRLAVGPGAGFEVMNVRRGERLASATALAEYHLGRGRIRPFGRLLAGANLPVGSDSTPMSGRSVGRTVHPSFGLLLAPPRGRWMQLSIDIGYRFSDVRFTGLTANLEELERDIGYQRFTFGLAARF